jgi:hypothetical protein
VALEKELRAQMLVTVTLLAVGIRNGLDGRPSIAVEESAAATSYDRRDITLREVRAIREIAIDRFLASPAIELL